MQLIAAYLVKTCTTCCCAYKWLERELLGIFSQLGKRLRSGCEIRLLRAGQQVNAVWSDRMCPVLYGLNPDAVNYGNAELAWDPTHNSSTAEPTEAIDWFALPPTPTLLGSGLGAAFLQDDISIQSPRQPDQLGPSWNTPASSPLEDARSGPDSQAPATASSTYLDLPCTSEDGTRQQNSTQSRYTTERKLAQNREAQRRFRQRHKVQSVLKTPQLQSSNCDNPFVHQQADRTSTYRVFFLILAFMSGTLTWCRGAACCHNSSA